MTSSNIFVTSFCTASFSSITGMEFGIATVEVANTFVSDNFSTFVWVNPSNSRFWHEDVAASERVFLLEVHHGFLYSSSTDSTTCILLHNLSQQLIKLVVLWDCIPISQLTQSAVSLKSIQHLSGSCIMSKAFSVHLGGSKKIPIVS